MLQALRDLPGRLGRQARRARPGRLGTAQQVRRDQQVLLARLV